jgi:hypothetical protein
MGDYYAEIDGVNLDNVSKGLLLQVLDGLTREDLKDKLTSMPIEKAVETCWKLTSKTGANVVNTITRRDIGQYTFAQGDNEAHITFHVDVLGQGNGNVIVTTHLSADGNSWWVRADPNFGVVAEGRSGGHSASARQAEEEARAWIQNLSVDSYRQVQDARMRDALADDPEAYEIYLERYAAKDEDVNGNEVKGLPPEDTWLDNEGQYNEELSHQVKKSNIQAECRYCGSDVSYFGEVCSSCRGDSSDEEVAESNERFQEYKQMFGSKTADYQMSIDDMGGAEYPIIIFDHNGDVLDRAGNIATAETIVSEQWDDIGGFYVPDEGVGYVRGTGYSAAEAVDYLEHQLALQKDLWGESPRVASADRYGRPVQASHTLTDETDLFL